MKLKLDPQKAKEFLLSHIEKFVFGLVVLGFLWFAQYTFFHREGIADTPSKLLEITNDAEKRIKKSPEKLPVEAKDYEATIKKTMDSIDPKDYAHRVLWCPPVFDPPPKRGEPRLLTVRDLRGSAGCAKVYVATQTPTGPTASPDETMLMEGAPPTGPISGMGRETAKGERWVVLTGLVPYKEQIEAYIEAFRAASRQSALTGLQPGAAPGGIPGAIAAPAPGLMEGPVPGMMGPAGSPTSAGADMPVYVRYHVQRVEVNSPGDAIEEADWEAGSINGKAKEEATRRWGSIATGPIGGTQQTDIGIHPLFWDQVLDFPLPRFADGRQLDDSFAHPPEIPLLKKWTYQIGPDGRPIIPTTTTSTETAETAASEKIAKPKPEVKDAPDMPGVFPGMGPRGPGEMPPGFVPGAMPPGMEGMGPMGPMSGGAPGSFSGTMRLPDYKLFRFIDRTVEPGKRYRYRVRLWLVNPNYKQNPRFLERPELGKEPDVMTPWSEPSNVVETPRDDRLLVLGMKWIGGAPEGKVALLKWIPDDGELATKEEEKVVRGQVLNLPKQKWPEEDTRKTSPASKPSTKQPPGMGPLTEDYELLMGAASQKSKKTSSKEKPSATPSGILGPGFGPQSKEPLEIDYQTDCLVVDLRGGYRIDLRGQGRASHSDPAYNAPGEMLLLHPEGYLYVQSELEDAEQYDKILQMRAPKYDERFGPGFMGMPPGMLEGAVPPPGGVPGELMPPGEKGRPKPSSKTTPKTPKGAANPPRG